MYQCIITFMFNESWLFGWFTILGFILKKRGSSYNLSFVGGASKIPKQVSCRLRNPSQASCPSSTVTFCMVLRVLGLSKKYKDRNVS